MILSNKINFIVIPKNWETWLDTFSITYKIIYLLSTEGYTLIDNLSTHHIIYFSVEELMYEDWFEKNIGISPIITKYALI